jgi:hypothetical protein
VLRTNQDWCTSALKKMKEASPLSLKVLIVSANCSCCFAKPHMQVAFFLLHACIGIECLV